MCYMTCMYLLLLFSMGGGFIGPIVTAFAAFLLLLVLLILPFVLSGVEWNTVECCYVMLGGSVVMLCHICYATLHYPTLHYTTLHYTANL